jgi:ABC-type transport system involved in multi-copper enzyme maturation permease subunit
MILQLALKDLRGYRRFIAFNIFLPGIVWTMLVFSRYYPWHAYIMFCNLAICAAGSYYTFSEKKQNLNILFCSLPVTRWQIVLSKYLTSLVIIIIGIVVFSIAVYMNHLLSENAAMNFGKLMHPKIIFMCFYLNTVFFSIFLPAVFWFGLFGMAISFTIAMISSIYSYVVLFRPYRVDFQPYFTADTTVNTLIAIVLMCSLSLLSFGITNKIFKKKNL